MNIDERVLNCLPDGIKNKLAEYDRINEIRITKNRPLCIVFDGKQFVTTYTVSSDDVEHCVNNFCENSVHTYFETIKKGYIPFSNGYRIGVCGKAVSDGSGIKNISQITSLNIRVPSSDFSIPQDLLKNISNKNGLLVYSPANAGKTTFLKALIAHLSLPPNNRRISVIDCKNELYSEKLHSSCPVDFFSGYPKYEAIDMAVQNMSPDTIICDEIGLQDDVIPLINCKNCGVNIICSAHASSAKELFSRNNIRTLLEASVFEGFIGISIRSGRRIFEYTAREEIFK